MTGFYTVVCIMPIAATWMDLETVIQNEVSQKEKNTPHIEGWDGEGDGRGVQEGGDICIPMADSY